MVVSPDVEVVAVSVTDEVVPTVPGLRAAMCSTPANSRQEIRIGIPSMSEGYEALLSPGKGSWMKMSL